MNIRRMTLDDIPQVAAIDHVSPTSIPHQTFPVLRVEYELDEDNLTVEQYAVVRLADGSTEPWWVGGYGWIEYADTGGS